MQIGKLNITEWTWNNMKLANPFLIIWKLIWIIPVYIAVIIFAIIMTVYNFDMGAFGKTIRNNI